ncbi:MAG: SelL-related redox protein [Anaerolineales bacterium]
MQKIPTAVLDTPVEGVNLTIGTLRDQLSNGPTLLVFLRHFGCIFCREVVTDLRRVVKATPAYPRVLFFYQGTEAQGRAFFGHFWPDAAYVADVPRYFYTAFGLERANMVQLFGPQVWACSVRATAKGNVGGRVVGDSWQMPGLFLAHGNQIVWQHEYRHAGDHPLWREVLAHVPGSQNVEYPTTASLAPEQRRFAR